MAKVRATIRVTSEHVVELEVREYDGTDQMVLDALGDELAERGLPIDDIAETNTVVDEAVESVVVIDPRDASLIPKNIKAPQHEMEW